MPVLPEASRSPSVRVQRRQQRTRAQLTRAAATIIAEKGVEGLRLREVTDAADVGFGSFDNYFESKEGLVEAVVLDLMSALAGTLIAHVSQFDDPAEAAGAAHRWFVRNTTEDPETARLMANLDQATAEVLLRALGVDATQARELAYRDLPSVTLLGCSDR